MTHQGYKTQCSKRIHKSYKPFSISKNNDKNLVQRKPITLGRIKIENFNQMIIITNGFYLFILSKPLPFKFEYNKRLIT